MTPRFYGVVGRFETPDALLEAIRCLRRRDRHLRLEAYAPYAVEGLSEALNLPRGKVPLFTLVGGVLGGASGFFMQWYAAVVSFPVNIGGRPLNSWPMFIPVTFEMTILGAALAAVLGMLAVSGLPRLHHPIFDAPCFGLATRDRYFLCLRPPPGMPGPAPAKQYREVLESLGATASDEVWT